MQWLRRKYPKANWRWLRRHHLSGWWPTHDGIALFNAGGVAVTRYRYRGTKIPDARGKTTAARPPPASSNCNS